MPCGRCYLARSPASGSAGVFWVSRSIQRAPSCSRHCVARGDCAGAKHARGLKAVAAERSEPGAHAPTLLTPGLPLGAERPQRAKCVLKLLRSTAYSRHARLSQAQGRLGCSKDPKQGRCSSEVRSKG